MELKGKIKDYLFVILAVSIWGSSYAVKEYAVGFVQPIHIVFIGNLLTALILLGYCLVKRSSLKQDKVLTFQMMFCGALGISICQALINYGITFVGGVAASVIFAVIPCMCLIIDVFIRKLRVNFKCTLGVVLGSCLW